MMGSAQQESSHRLLVLVVLIWALSWPVIKIGVSAVPPIWFACLRYVIATICFFSVVSFRGELKRPSPSDWPLIVVSGVLQMAAYSALTAVALTRLPPGRASVLAFSTPLWVVPLAAWRLGEPIAWSGLVGVAMGLAGVLLIASPAIQLNAHGQIVSYALLMCAAAAWAVSIVFVRVHHFQASALALAPWQMLLAALLLLPIATILEGRLPLMRARAVAALAYVGPIATAFAYWAIVEAGRSVRATTISMALLAVPSLGLLISALALHEAMSVSVVLGVVLIGAGIRLATTASELSPM